MIRSILLPLAEGPLSKSTMDHAFWLAGKDGGCIHALAVIDVKTFEIPVLGTPDGFMPSVVSPPIAESQALLTELNSQAKERLALFAKECGGRGIPCSIDCRTGIPGEIVVREAMAHDIVVMARTGYGRAAIPEEKLDPLVSLVIRGSIRPVMVAGPKLRGGEALNLLVAFDGSIHAGRALSVAAELGARPGVSCTIVAVSASEDLGMEMLAPAESYLLRHNVTPKRQVILGSKPSEIICDLVGKAGADILIMGAYGHRPMREMLFGSTTERVLAHCPATVILQS